MKSLSKEYQEVFEIWKKAVSREYPMTLVIGEKSDQKFALINQMGEEFTKLKKSVITVTDWDTENPPVGFLIILLLADLQQNKTVSHIAHYLSKHIIEGKALIIECSSMSSFKQKYDMCFTEFVTSKCIVVNCPSIAKDIITL